jgi:iron(III) transport system permease protein
MAGPRPLRARPRLISRRTAAYAVVLVVAGLVLAPIVSIVVMAWRGDAELWPHLAAYVLPVAFRDTALLLLGVAAITGTVGVGTAWLVTAYRFPFRNALLWLLPLPLATPTYIVAYVYVDLFDALGFAQRMLQAVFGIASPATWFINVRSLPGAIFVIGFVLYPYVYLSARALFQMQSAPLIEAARILGATRWRLVRDVALPLARPALAVGLSLALLETLNDIGASEYLGVRTVTLSVFTTWLNRSSLPGAAQIACFMLAIVMALVMLERHGRRRRGYGIPAQDARMTAPIVLHGSAAWLATFACAIPVGIGFVLPAGYLLHATLARGLLSGFDPALGRHAIVTVALAAVATAVTILLGLIIATAWQFARGRLMAACSNVASLGYAIPGTVLALGLLAPLVLVDEALNAVARLFGGAGMGLLLAGSAAALVIAYVIRFLAISIGLMRAGFARITRDFDDAARLLGAGPAALARTIHLPLLRPAVWGAALLVFVDCLKELPATLLLRPLNVETLATYVYQFATRGDFEEGALAALLIVAAGVLPIMHMTGIADAAMAPDVEASSA